MSATEILNALKIARGAMTPDMFLAEVTRIVVETAKDLWRSEPLSEAELSVISDRILLLAGKERSDERATGAVKS